MITQAEQLKCAQRELAIREKVYPSWVNAGRMKSETAAHEIECMRAIVATLDRQLDLFEVSEEMKADFRKKHPPAHCECCGAELPMDAKLKKCEDCNDTMNV